MPTLSQRLFSNLPDGFFRPLVGRSAAVYVDCADALVEAAGEAGRIPVNEARALVIGIVEADESPRGDESEVATLGDVRVRAAHIINQMLEVAWIEEYPESLHERWILISPTLRPLLDMLRELAADNIGELKSFGDTLDGVCRDLETDGILDPNHNTSEDLRSRVSDLNARLARAITQLHSVEKVIHGFEQRQLQTKTGAETLQLFYSDFYEGQHMVCNDVLLRRGLLGRLHRARDVVRAAMENPFVQERLAVAFRESAESEQSDGWQLAGDQLNKLMKALGGIQQRADAVDARIASFHQLSRQRFFYQSQMRGRRPEMVRQLCDAVHQTLAGQRFSDLDSVALDQVFGSCRGLFTTEVELFGGTTSMRKPHRTKLPISLTLTDACLAPPDEAEQARLREQMRVALTPQRAARLVRKLLPHVGDTMDTSAMKIEGKEMFLDLVAAASFNHVHAVGGMLRWRTNLTHAYADVTRKDVPRDSVEDWKVERFSLTRTK